MPDPELFALAARYDAAILDPAARSAYDGSDFFNVGDWSDGPWGPPGGLGEAAARLVERHLGADTDKEAAGVRLVLDVGCGLGAGAAMMARRYPDALVVGVNFSQVQAAHASHAAPAARFAVMDAARLAIAGGVADRVHAVEAAFHFDTRDAFLAEAHRALRPGGKAILTDILYRDGYGASIPAANVWTGEAEYRARCERAGFAVDQLVDITDCTLQPFYAHLAARGRGVEARLFRRVQDAYYFVVLHKPSA